ncbi:MAG TPA: cytochrome c biogenesis protein DipZ [Rickettsiales bacterium]|nr:cytochrome c biogenesis protein DipZ [Rickettsiales bacterium]
MNILETSSAFLEGLALIASPCILPVLPLVLGASAGGGKKQPFGVIAGFILTFSLFALFSRKLVAVFGIDLDIIKHISLALLAVFGLVLLSGKLSSLFSSWTQKAAAIGNLVPSGKGDTLLGGLMIGALIGLVWTPCAGPILAVVLVQVIRQQTDASGMAILFAFALGAGLPMLAIALTGRKLMERLGFLHRHAETIRKGCGLAILLAAIYIASGVDFSTHSTASSTPISEQAGLVDALSSPYEAPEIAGITDWLNSPPLTLASLKGKVVLVDFWTYSCINCIRTLPYITQWDKLYRDKGLVIIGVHSPEFEFEKKPENVKAALAQYGIHYPVALDSHLSTWSNFNNLYWPAHYLIDQQGRVVYTHFGEGGYDVTEHNIRTLLGVSNSTPKSAEQEAADFNRPQTPETYLGYARADRFGGESELKANSISSFHFPATLDADHWALQGQWDVSAERITAQENGAAIRMHFRAGNVFLVLGNEGSTPASATILVNGKPYKTLTVDRHMLYTIISQDKAGEGIVDIIAGNAGLEAYAFTFGW